MLLVPSTLSVSGEMALFGDLVRIGEEKTFVTLSVGLRLFLIQCLVEHLRDPDIVWRVLAFDFLESDRRRGNERVVFLKRSGDASLILAGLFPERALRLRVSPSYFRQMGQSFFGTLAVHFLATGATEQGRFFNEVARGFETLEQVLGAARKTDDEWSVFRQFLSRLN